MAPRPADIASAFLAPVLIIVVLWLGWLLIRADVDGSPVCQPIGRAVMCTYTEDD